MASKISKKFGQFRQWTGEKFGSERKTEAPNDFKNMVAETELRKEGLEALYESLVLFLKTFEKKRINPLDSTKLHPLEILGVQMNKHGNLVGAANAYGKALIDTGELLQKLSYTESKKTYIVQLEQIIAYLKDYQSLKKKFSNRRLDYDSKLNKLNKSTKEKPALELEVETLKQKYEESYSNMTELMEKIKTKELELANGLYLFIQALAKYYQESHLIMDQEKGSIFLEFQAPVNINTLPSLVAGSSLSSSLSSLKISKECENKKEKKRIKVKAKYDFSPDPSSGEIRLCKGDVLELTSKHPLSSSSPSTSLAGSSGDESGDGGWWSGINHNNEQGLFPASYVEIVADDEENKCNVHKTNVTIASGKGDPPPVCDTSAGATASHLDNKRDVKIPAGPKISTSFTATEPSCYVCGCSDFSKNLFRKGACNNCFHVHQANEKNK